MALPARLHAVADRVRNSLFIVPTAFVLAGVVLGQAGIVLDAHIEVDANALPVGVASTVQSARAVLSTVAGATITVAGIAFSVAILTIQLASSQYSPRVVGGLFRDPFNKRVIGVVAGTFAYCLVVLRAVRTALDDQGTQVVPTVSVSVGVLLGIVAILAIIAFIDHNAHSMDISQILASVTRDTAESAARPWSDTSLHPADPERPDELPTGPGTVVPLPRSGWIQFLDVDRLLEPVPEGGTVRLETAVGRYAVRGAPACTIWPPIDDVDAATRCVGEAMTIGQTRTLRQDPAFGIRQLVDVALKALSPGVNDPTTAQDAIWHVADALHHLLDRPRPVRDLRDGSRRLVLAHVVGPVELVTLAYTELRLAAAPQPAVCVALVESIDSLRRSLPDLGEDVRLALEDQTDAIVAACRRAAAHPDDLVELEAAIAAAGAAPDPAA